MYAPIYVTCNAQHNIFAGDLEAVIQKLLRDGLRNLVSAEEVDQSQECGQRSQQERCPLLGILLACC